MKSVIFNLYFYCIFFRSESFLVSSLVLFFFTRLYISFTHVFQVKMPIKLKGNVNSFFLILQHARQDFRITFNFFLLSLSDKPARLSTFVYILYFFLLKDIDIRCRIASLASFFIQKFIIHTRNTIKLNAFYLMIDNLWFSKVRMSSPHIDYFILKLYFNDLMIFFLKINLCFYHNMHFDLKN